MKSLHTLYIYALNLPLLWQRMARAEPHVPPIRSVMIRFVAGLVACLSISLACAAGEGGKVVINGQALNRETLTFLQRLYPVPILPGRYWYDSMSGAYGVEGEPVAGQMLPNLRLGGSLRANASRGTSGVFFNGRQLTMGEKAYLEQICQTPVMPARYWVNAQGIGGFEGRQASFNLSLCGPPAGQRGGGSSTRTFCDADGSCRSTGIFGSILTSPQ